MCLIGVLGRKRGEGWRDAQHDWCSRAIVAPGAGVMGHVGGVKCSRTLH